MWGYDREREKAARGGREGNGGTNCEYLTQNNYKQREEKQQSSQETYDPSTSPKSESWA